MVIKQKRLNLKEMEIIAKKATYDALEAYSKPKENLENLTLGSGISDTEGTFELYIAKERPEDAEVLSRATVNRFTGDVQVEVFLNK